MLELPPESRLGCLVRVSIENMAATNVLWPGPWWRRQIWRSECNRLIALREKHI